MIALIPLVLGMLCCATGFGLQTIRGNEPGLWDEDRTSVVIADFVAAKPVPERLADLATLRPLATLSGSFDPAASSHIDAMLFSNGNSSIPSVPQAGCMVIAVIREVEGKWNIESADCLFMPDARALVVISGLNDPKVRQTVDAIHKARHSRNTSASTQQRTQPSTKP